MMRVVRFFIGVLLLPVCLVVTRTLLGLVRSVQPASASALPPAFWVMTGAFGLWLIVYGTLPRPVRTYVLAHELTHALWGALMGARVGALRVSRRGGSVKLSRSNFLVTLAPYFFPLYTVILIGVYYGLKLFRPVEGYALLWLGLVGFTWGFHFTFTLSMLTQRQTDIRACGRLFSYTVIYLLNAIGIALWVVIVSPVTFRHMAELFLECGDDTLRLLIEGGRRAALPLKRQ